MRPLINNRKNLKMNYIRQSSSIWFLHVRFESKVTPRYLTVETCWIFTPSIFRLNDLCGFNFLEWKRIKLVLRILSANLLDFIHSATAFSSWFNFTSRSFRFLQEQYMLVSSANKWKVSNFEALGKSLIYNKNNKGPRTDPWGTPQVTDRESESWPLTHTNCSLLDR